MEVESVLVKDIGLYLKDNKQAEKSVIEKYIQVYTIQIEIFVSWTVLIDSENYTSPRLTLLHFVPSRILASSQNNAQISCHWRCWIVAIAATRNFWMMETTKKYVKVWTATK